MSNSLLTIDMITQEALVILHQKLNFIGNINRQYDDSFANEGAKIGQSLRIRLPNQYTATDSATLAVNDTVEQSVTLPVTTQTHVGMRFTSQQLTMSLDDFSERIIEPAMSVLAARIESNALSMVNSVWNAVPNIGAPMGMRQVLLARKRLNDSLAPNDDLRRIILNTQDNADLVDANKGLFQDSTAVREQYREGAMGRTGGFDFFENTLITPRTTGTAAATTGYTVNGANQVGSAITVATGSATFVAGDIIQFAGCFEVHPETKANTGRLQNFVVTANYAGGAGNLGIAPAIVTSGPRQNVSASPTNGGAVTKIGGNATVYQNSIAFHRDAFTFATADLVLPRGTDMASRKVMDGISMRIVRDYDINEDRMPCRVDVLYGFVAMRPELACRILNG